VESPPLLNILGGLDVPTSGTVTLWTTIRSPAAFAFDRDDHM
jgi:hypothetical protein